MSTNYSTPFDFVELIKRLRYEVLIRLDVDAEDLIKQFKKDFGQ